MAGVAIDIDVNDLVQQSARITGVIDAPLDQLAEGIGRLVQEQTRRRIEEEKTAPDGTSWKANNAGTSILYAEGHLSRSVDYIASSTGVTVGSGLVYARIHQKGGEIKPVNAKLLRFTVGNATVFASKVTMPRRQWLGLSDENKSDVEAATVDWMRSLLQ
ncbi:phage virion morphogenesis protein [Breoghania sp.]|uniref:phage virion morphogenesis protein n=1 Tax=Breoghania sp. TaxID=2065378 RepID=UPI0029CA413C|nr:phage virion morphogenesis protein [Breoghania sp.]